MTKCSFDLMKEQLKEGNEVALLWPGEIKLIDHRVHITKDRSVAGIESFEIINPIPVSYDEGIEDVGAFMKEGNKAVYSTFLKEHKPEVIHVHTFMGLHKSFLIAAKELKIRLIFTTHDFFPICPKVTMYRCGDVCKTIDTCNYCPECNLTALSMGKMQILQSPTYRTLKDSVLVKKLRKLQRDGYLSNSTGILGVPDRKVTDYQELREHYTSMLNMMDFIHYNSSLTKSVYDKYMGIFTGKVIPITHNDIADYRKLKEYNHSILRLTYLGPQGEGKGFFRLKAVLDKLWKKRKDFILNVFFRNPELPQYIQQHGRYRYDQLGKIMDESDVVITPNVWYETFGFTVIEALSYGVPVIVSDHVGAKDVIPDGGGIVFSNNEELASILADLTLEKLSTMNRSIVKTCELLNEKRFCEEIIRYSYPRATYESYNESK